MGEEGMGGIEELTVLWEPKFFDSTGSYYLIICLLGIFHMFCRLLFFFQNQVFKKNHEYHLSVKHFRSRSILSGLIWVQIICKVYQ